MRYDDEGHYQVPGEEFETVLDIFQFYQNGKSRREIAKAVDIPVATVQNVIDRREWYISRKKMVES